MSDPATDDNHRNPRPPRKKLKQAATGRTPLLRAVRSENAHRTRTGKLTAAKGEVLVRSVQAGCQTKMGRATRGNRAGQSSGCKRTTAANPVHTTAETIGRLPPESTDIPWG